METPPPIQGMDKELLEKLKEYNWKTRDMRFLIIMGEEFLSEDNDLSAGELAALLPSTDTPMELLWDVVLEKVHDAFYMGVAVGINQLTEERIQERAKK